MRELRRLAPQYPQTRGGVPSIIRGMPVPSVSRPPGINRSPVGTPQFMGPANATIEQVQNFITDQKKIKGFRFTVASGSSAHNIELSGTARLLLGIAILTDPTAAAGATPESVKLTINNEIVIDTVNPTFFSPDFCDDEYYVIPRPLSGTDQILLDVINPNASQDLTLAFYYL